MLVLILFSINMLPLQANDTSQNLKVSLQMNDVTIREVFNELEKQTNFSFFYNSDLIDTQQKVDVNVKKGNLEEILAILFEDTDIEYHITGNQILLKRKLPPKIIKNNSGEARLSDKDKLIIPVAIDQQTFAVAVTGNITDENNDPLPGATVMEKGTTNGTITDVNGNYTLSVSSPEATLVISFVGYISEEVAINGRSTVDMSLLPDITSLSEVVVIGYGTQKKSDLTGAVSQVSSEEINAFPVVSVDQALKGRSPGVMVSQNSGQPGARVQIQIRGGNSMIGDNSPLFVVDGFPLTGGIDFLNPADIESIDILKDASATAIYGARGANGVVIITSKRGKAGQKSSIEIDSYYGVQEEIDREEVLNARDYAIVVNEWLNNSGQEPFFVLDEVQNPGTDWQDAVFRKAPLQNHTLTFSGSSEKTRYALSGNYYDQEGIIINSGAKRGSFRLNLDHDMNDWFRMGVNVNLSRRERRTVPVDNGNYGNTILSGAVSAPPTLTIYDDAGLPTQIGQVYTFGSATMVNPMIFGGLYKDRSLTNVVVGNTNFEFSLAEGLSFTTRLGLEHESRETESFIPIVYKNDRGAASAGVYNQNSFLNENILSYTRVFGDIHNLNLVGGFTYQTQRDKYSSISVSGFSGNTTENYDLAAAETINTPISGISEWKLISYLGRASYSLKDRYLFTASLRADGSSRFGAENKWGIFPSAAIGWRISDESFMEEINFVTNLKLRASYGITGNTALSPYQSLDRISSVKAIYGNMADEIGYVPSGISNSNLKWETTAQTDIGVDLHILDSRLRFTFDYYKKNTTDLLASVPLPRSVGFSSILQNVGEIENKGYELSLDADVLTREFKWIFSAQISSNKNEIISLASDSDIYGDELNLFRSSMNIARVGEPFGSFYGLREDGLDEQGFIKYIDTNEDGLINTLDRVIIGNPYPDLVFGFNNNFTFKNFELSIFFQGVHGNDIFRATEGTNLNSFQRGTNQFADLIGNYWTEENPDPNAKYPKISSATLIDVSDRFIKDGSYLRLKSLKLAYNLPTQSLGINWISSAQLYLSGTNLLTFTKYPGIDPDVNTTGSDSQSVGNRLRTGIDQSAYPSAKMYAAGIKLNF